MRRSTKWLLAGGSAGATAMFAGLYGLLVRPWHLRWGATDDELRRPMPFDELIGSPNYFATRAITVTATPDIVWPLLLDRHALPPGTAVRSMEENRFVAFAPPEDEAEATWVVVLEPLESGRTRIISRNRARFPARAAAIVRYLLVDPAHFMFERYWLRALASRAERLASSPVPRSGTRRRIEQERVPDEAVFS
jgi:hypothetical protein